MRLDPALVAAVAAEAARDGQSVRALLPTLLGALVLLAFTIRNEEETGCPISPRPRSAQ